MKRATQKAFSTLLKQITPRHTWSAHPQLMKQMNWDNIAAKVSVVNEQYLPAYKATFNIYYQPEAVKELLTDNNIPYSVSTGGKVLILPVLEDAGYKMLWETMNPLRQIIEDNKHKYTYFEYILAEGTIDETQNLTADMVTLGAADLMLDIAQKYEANAAVAFHAKVSERFGQYYLDVSAAWYEDGIQVQPSLYAAPIENVILTEGHVDDASLKQALELAVNDVLARLGDHKRNEGLVEVNRPARLFLRFKPSGPADLEKLQSAILELSTIREFKLRVLNVQDSVFQVDFYGDVLDFQKQLSDIGIAVEATNIPIVWKVRFLDNASQGGAGAFY